MKINKIIAVATILLAPTVASAKFVDMTGYDLGKHSGNYSLNSDTIFSIAQEDNDCKIYFKTSAGQIGGLKEMTIKNQICSDFIKKHELDK